MDDHEFWNLIDLARARTSDGRSADPAHLRDVLDRLDDDAVHSFGRRFYTLLCELNRANVWGAADMMGSELSGDSFYYFRSWLIGKGHDAVRTALTDPDGLGAFCTDDEVTAFLAGHAWPENEELEYVAVEILERRGRGDPREEVNASPDGEPTGARLSRYPRLSGRFGA